ncbi:hypothetical protein L1887_57139 [Cichorium endivia]|nr:hypothetical protein L1887_57139 [Cichorium endivia]
MLGVVGPEVACRRANSSAESSLESSSASRLTLVIMGRRRPGDLREAGALPPSAPVAFSDAALLSRRSPDGFGAVGGMASDEARAQRVGCLLVSGSTQVSEGGSRAQSKSDCSASWESGSASGGKVSELHQRRACYRDGRDESVRLDLDDVREAAASMMQGAGQHVLGMRGQESVLCVDRQARVAADDTVAGRAASTRVSCPAGCPSHSAPSALQLSHSALHPEFATYLFSPASDRPDCFAKKKVTTTRHGQRTTICSQAGASCCAAHLHLPKISLLSTSPRSLLCVIHSSNPPHPAVRAGQIQHTGGDTKESAYSYLKQSCAHKARRERRIEASNSIL